MKALLHRLYGMVPAPIALNPIGQVRVCCGALIGIFLTGLVTYLMLGPNAGIPLLIAPMGASAVLLFAVPTSPMAQPWSIVGGNLVSAAVGVTCAQWINDPIVASAVAISSAIGLMFVLRCLHPPGGAIALTAILGGPVIQAEGYNFLLAPVAVNSVLLLAVAIIFNRATRRLSVHPIQQEHNAAHPNANVHLTNRLGFTAADLDEALKQYGQLLDVSRDDLEAVLRQTEVHAYRRRFGEIRCGDIMSRDVVTVDFGTTLEDAWTLLNKHRIKALPVINRARRVIGIITLADFMRHANLDVYDGFDARLRQFIRRILHTHSEKPEVVGQIMTAKVYTGTVNMYISELVPLLSDLGLHYIPIIDGERRLVGMVTQADLIAALHGRRIEEMIAA